MLWNGKKQDKEQKNGLNNGKSDKENKIKEKNEEANHQAKDLLKNTEKLQELIREAEEKAHGKGDKKGFVPETWENLKTMFELVKLYISGDYRNIPYRSIILITGSIIYFVMPADAIPDIIAVLGFTDDAAVIGFTLGKSKEILIDLLIGKNRWN